MPTPSTGMFDAYNVGSMVDGPSSGAPARKPFQDVSFPLHAYTGPLDYAPKTEMREHQKSIFYQTRDLPNWALLLDMGTGKTKVVLDTAAHLFDKGKVTLLFVVAPSGVFKNWVVKQAPLHLPDRCNARLVHWTSTMTAAQERASMAAIDSPVDPSSLLVVVCNIEAFGVAPHYYKKKAGAIFPSLVRRHRTLMVVDESWVIKSPSAEVTKRLIELGKSATYRRILNGTPMANSPLDYYTQFKFLGPQYLGCKTFSDFKARHAVYVDQEIRHGPRAGDKFPLLVRYKNLELLYHLASKVSSRVLKSECLNLPPKTYSTREVAMTSEQASAYRALRLQQQREAPEDDPSKVALNALGRALARQRLVGGFWRGPKHDGEVIPFFNSYKANPKVRETLAVVSQVSEKMVIWARFRHEIELITTAINTEFGGEQAETFYGGMTTAERDSKLSRFDDPNSSLRILVGQVRSGGVGVDMVAASTMIFYSNDQSFFRRFQAEDRINRDGQVRPMTLIDIVAPGTVDETILHAFKVKKELSEVLTGDPVALWR